jgi:hypothetical protein
MPRYNSQNLASFGSASSSSGGDGKRRFCYGKNRNVIIVGGKKMLDDGLCLKLLPTYAVDDFGKRLTNPDGTPVLTTFRDTNGFGDWCRTYECVSWFGQPSLHFIVWDGNPAVNRYESPVWLLYRAAYKNKETPGIGPLFCDLLNRQAGFQQQTHVGSLKRPEPIIFVSATQLYSRPDRSVGFGCYDLADQKEGNSRIFGFKKTAGESLFNALHVQDQNGNYFCGDMLAPGATKLITVMSKSFGATAHPKPPRPLGISADGPDYLFVPPYAFSSQNPNETVILGKPNPSQDGKTSGEQHWVVLHDTYNGQPVTFGNYAPKIATQNSSFDEFMHVPTFEEQADLMADAFPREALDFAWREHPEYLRYLRGGTTTVQAPQTQFTGHAPAAAPPVAPPPAAAIQQPVHAGGAMLNDADIDPEAEAAFAQLQAGMAMAAAPSAPFQAKGGVNDVVAAARAAAAAKLAARNNG